MGLVRRRRTGVLARHRIVHLRRRASALRLHTGRVHRRVLSSRFDQRQQRLVGIIHLGLQQSLRRGSAVLGRLCRVEGRLQRLWPTQLWIDRMRVRLLLLLWLAECRRRLAILGRSKDGLVAVGQGANSLAVAIFNPLVEPAHAAATTQARQDLGGGGSLATRGGEEAFLGGLACSLQCARGKRDLGFSPAPDARRVVGSFNRAEIAADLSLATGNAPARASEWGTQERSVRLTLGTCVYGRVVPDVRPLASTQRSVRTVSSARGELHTLRTCVGGHGRALALQRRRRRWLGWRVWRRGWGCERIVALRSSIRHR